MNNEHLYPSSIVVWNGVISTYSLIKEIMTEGDEVYLANAEEIEHYNLYHK